jgi:hypothetical protein
VSGALSRRAETLFAGLSDVEQAWAKQLFLRLVTLGEGVEDTRRRVHLVELASLGHVEGGQDRKEDRGHTTAVMETILDHFGKHRLLTFDRDPASREPTVEVAHEALLREWPRLRKWLNESRIDIRNQQAIGNAAAEWLAADRDPSFLLRGTRLSRYADWMQGAGLTLTNEEQEFLNASLLEQEARQAEKEAARQRELDAAHKLAQEQRQRAEEGEQAAARQRTRNRIITAFGIIAILVAITAAYFWFQAQAQTKIARSGELSAQVFIRSDDEFELAWLLSAEAFSRADTLQTRQANDCI